MEDRTSWMGFIIPSLIAILSGLSVGSGGLLVIWLTELLGVSPESARGINLLFFTVSATVALLFHIKRRNLDLRLIGSSAFFALCGTLAGSFLGKRLDPAALKKIFGAFLVFSGLYSLFGSGKQKNKEKKDAYRKKRAFIEKSAKKLKKYQNK